MTVGSGIERVGGCLLLYRSTDLHHWEYMHPMASGAWNGKPTSNPVDDGEMWECPELFALDGRHVLIYSTLGKVYWQSGVLDAASMTFKEQKSGMLDLGTFYAPKSQVDAQGKRVLWGWIPERRSQDEMLKAGWSGLLSLPRVLNLDSDGRLRMQFLPKLQTLRKHPLEVDSRKGKTTTVLPRATGELLCQGQGSTGWSLQIHLPAGDPLELRYSPDRHAFLFEANEVLLHPAESPSVHAFVDGSVVEILIAGSHSLTRRFYYEGEAAPDILIQVTGGPVQLHAWPISPISPDRLTSARS
jgi:beta-fructofuranosidase